MQSELSKLRIDKSQKARRDEKSVWPWALAALLLLGGGLTVWQWNKASSAVAVRTVRVVVPAGATSEKDLVVLSAAGYVTAAHKIELASKVVGRVAWVGVEMGDKIKKDQVLVRLEDDEFKARVAQQQGELDNAKAKLAELSAGSRPQEIGQAQANVNAALAELATAERNFQRLKELEESNSISRQEIADAETLVAQRQAQVDGQRQMYDLAKAGPRTEMIDGQKATVRQLEGGLALTMVELNNTVIRSTIDGTVLERNVEVGEFVTTGFVGDRGAKGYVVSIADLNDLRVELDINQKDFGGVLPRQPCWIVTDAYPDRRYDGEVYLISPEANRQKATVQVRVKVLNPDDRLKPDMNATVSFLSPEKLAATKHATTAPATAPTTGPAGNSADAPRPAIRVPATAVRGTEVFVVESGKAVVRTVTVGATANGQTEIRKGLIGGEDVVTDPPTTLKPGDPVTTGP